MHDQGTSAGGCCETLSNAAAGTPNTNAVRGHAPRQSLRAVAAASLASAALFYVAFAPLPLHWLGFIAPLGWLWLAATPERLCRRGYLLVYLSGFLLWAALMEGIRRPHWACYFGLAGLSVYLAVYPLLFVVVLRKLLHGWRVPLVIAAPLAWTGFEWIRGNFATGFGLGHLGHTQTGWPALLQVADLCGAYGVSFVVMAAPAAALQAYRAGSPARWPPLIAAALLYAAVLGYGAMQLAARPLAPHASGAARVALIQGSIDVVFEYDPERMELGRRQHLELTHKALQEHDRIDLVAWPESAFPATMVRIVDPPPSSGAPQLEPRLRARAEEYRAEFEAVCRREARRLQLLAPTPQPQLAWIGGSQAFEYRGNQTRLYNTAILVDAEGNIVGHYDKMHPVMFGEYVPLGEQFPWLYGMLPLPIGLSRGAEPRALPLGELRFTPNICFESTVPHLLSGQMLRLERQGRLPDAIVNLTNDGWFYGGTILDLHYNCGVMRAVEQRRPFLIAANTGISAWIDEGGRARAVSKRRTLDVIVAEVAPQPQSLTIYARSHDLFAIVCWVLAVGLWMLPRKSRAAAAAKATETPVTTAAAASPARE